MSAKKKNVKKAPAKAKKAAKTPQVKKSTPVVKKSAKKIAVKATASKKPALKKPVSKKPVSKKPAAKKPGAKKAGAVSSKKAASQSGNKPIAQMLRTPVDATPQKQPVKEQHKPRPLSIQPRPNNRPGGSQQPGMPERRVIDRTRLGSIQAKLFRPGAVTFEQRQKLSMLVNDVALMAAKPKPVKSQIADELAKVSRAVKSTITDATMKAEILNDIDAFATVVKQF